MLLKVAVGGGAAERLDAAAEAARDRGMALMRGRGREHERGLPFGVAVDMFEGLWAAGLDESERSTLAVGPVRAAAGLLDGGPAASAGDAGFAVIRGLAWLARRLADREPAAAADRGGREPGGLALVIDDLHDLDGPTLRFLAYLAARLDTSAIAFIAALRPGLPSEDAAAMSAIRSRARVVRPPLLTPPQVVALTRAALPGASPRFCAACAGASGGAEGLLTALLAELQRRGARPSDAEADRIPEIVPEPLLRDVTTQLARLPAPAQALARAVAGLGDRIPLDRACAAAQLADDEVPDAVDALVAADLLAPGLPLGYLAPLVRTAIRQSLTLGEQIALAHNLPGQLERPRAVRAPEAGVGSLTPSERRVGELAARGMTTREIAAALFVTTKTVEFHLRNVYRKLDVPSTRLELTRVLGPTTLAEAPVGPVGDG